MFASKAIAAGSSRTTHLLQLCLTLALSLAALQGCGSDESLEQQGDRADAGELEVDAGLPSQAAPLRFVVSGAVDGLVGSLVLALDDEQLQITKNGPFAFKQRLRPGDPFEVLVVAQPDNEYCTLENATGSVAPEGPEQVLVYCEPGNPGLTDIKLSTGALDPPFEPGTARYRVDVPLWIEQVSLSPLLSDSDVRVSINDTEFQEDAVVIDLVLGQNSVAVQARAQSGELRSYAIDIYRATHVVEDAYGKATVPSESAQLGHSMSLDGDWLAIGAPGHSSDARGINGDEGNLDRPLSGAVYIFHKTDTGWQQAAFLKAHNADADDLFGFSVALEGNTLAVGAPEEDGDSPGVNGEGNSNEAPTSGAVYLFRRSGSEWTQTAYVKASMPSISASFGHSVALAQPETEQPWRLAVGAYHDANSAVGINPDMQDMSAPNSGAVHLFEDSGDGWTETAYIKASNTDPGDGFGSSVALDGKLLITGAPGEESAGQGPGADQSNGDAFASGAAYLFENQGEALGWVQVAYLKPEHSAADFRFGASVALDGNTAVVGALTEPSAATGIDPEPDDGSAPEAGAVFVFDRNQEGAWEQAAFIKASNSDQRDHFGAVVALSGNALAVGAPLEASAQLGIDPPQDDNTAPGAGAVYLFFRKDGQWSQQTYLKASNAQPGDNFGLSLGFDGTQLAVGAAYEDSTVGGVTSAGGPNNAARAAGAVYWFR